MQGADTGLRVPGWPRRLGAFLFHFDGDRWAWSEQIEWMHGYRPGTVVADRGAVLPRIHPDDCTHITDCLHEAACTHQPFSSRHRIIDAHNQTREMVMVGAPFYVRGIAVGIQGYCFDMTPADSAAHAVETRDGQLAAHLRMRADTGGTDAQRCWVRTATRC